MLAKIEVTIKPDVLDPQGKAILHALHTLGFDQVTDVRVGKRFAIQLSAASESGAEVAVREMCEKLLANPVIESYVFSVETEAP